MRGDPWGNSAYGALRWSYGMLAKSESMPSVFADMVGGTKNRTDMTMLDHRAQGAMIRSIVHKALRVRMTFDSVIVATFLPRPARQRLAGGGVGLVDPFLPQRRDAVIWLANYVAPALGVSRANAAQIVLQYSTGQGSVRRLTKLLGVRTETVMAIRARIYTMLDEERDRALVLAGEALARAGLIEEEEREPAYG